MIVKKYKVENVYFEIEIESPRDGILTIPVDWKLPTNFFKTYFINISEKEFDEDMAIMIPIFFGDDWMEMCFKHFQYRVKFHIEKFNRILPADLECYVAELILVFSSIGKFIKQPLSQEERQSFFQKILTDVSDTLNIPVELKFIKAT